MAGENSIDIVTLGRPFHLGMLYDIRRDAIIPGTTLRKPDTLKNNTSIRRQPFTGYEIVTQDSLQHKALALGIEANLKLSLAGGLISVSGSAKYAEDSQQTKHATRLTLKYSTTTHFEQLTMEHLGKGKLNYPDLQDANIATHVVAGVLYGAEAFFIFDCSLSHDEKNNEIEGTFKAMLNKIPKFSIGGEAKLKLNEKEENCMKKNELQILWRF